MTTMTTEEAAQLADIQAKLAAHPLPLVRMTPQPNKPKDNWASRFGGQPYWPADTPYPEAPDGEPLHILAQLNFDEMPNIPGYPETGILQFFIANDDLYGLQYPEQYTQSSFAKINQQQDTFRVVYHTDIRQDARQLKAEFPAHDDEDMMPVAGEYALTFEADNEPMNIVDYRLSSAWDGDVYDLPDSVGEALYDEDSGNGSKVGGYAFFTQDDPRDMDSDGEWLLLLQIDTSDEEGVDIMWGDSGVGHFFIRPEDLAKQDFSNVWYNWDCC